jgi:uncharacterized protein DUF4337
MPDELSELQENAEHGAHEKSLAPVTVTMAVFAVLVASVSLLGHRSHTEEIILQTKATDQWAYFQAKDIRRHSYETFLDQLTVFTVQSADQAEKLKTKYEKEVDRYKDELKEIEEKARDNEKEMLLQQKRADRFDLGEVLLEAGLVICSITLLTRRRFYWAFGLLLGIAGVCVGVAGLFVR